MNFSYLVSKKLINAPKKSFTRVVYKIGIVSISLGISFIVIAMLIMQGFQRNMEAKLTDINGHIKIVQYDSENLTKSGIIGDEKLKSIRTALCRQIEKIIPFAYKTVLLKHGDNIEGLVLKGLEIHSIKANLQQYIVKGSIPNSNKITYSKEILLSENTACKLGLSLGEEVVVCILQENVRYRKLKVAGIYKSYLPEMDDRLAFCDIKMLQQINNWRENEVDGYDVFLLKFNKLSEASEAILNVIDYDLKLESVKDVYSSIFDWLDAINKNVIIFIMLMIIVINFNLVSIIIIQLMDRTAMIGMLRVMGATNKQIILMVYYNNIYMFLKGMLWGNFGGLLLGAMQYYCKIIRIDPTNYYIKYVPITWNWPFIVGINLSTISLSAFVMLITTAIILNVKTIKALHTR